MKDREGQRTLQIDVKQLAISQWTANPENLAKSFEFCISLVQVNAYTALFASNRNFSLVLDHGLLLSGIKND